VYIRGTRARALLTCGRVGLSKHSCFCGLSFFFFETPFGEKTRQSPEISIKHHSGPALLPLAWCLTEKKEAGGFGAL
jgi:hypothetical protein